MKAKTFEERLHIITGLSMDLTGEILNMKFSQAPDYDYALDLVKELQKASLEMIDIIKQYENKSEREKVEIPSFINAQSA